MMTFGAYDSSGAPLSGLAGTLAWSVYRNASTGAASAGPAFAELGTSGLYTTSPAATHAGIVDCGATASPRYLFVGAASVVVVPAFDATGAPVAGLTPSWQGLFDTSDGSTVTPPPPTITDLGGGLYRVDGLEATWAGRLDLGASQNPRYQVIGLSADSSGPVISDPTPTVNTSIAPGQPLGFTITDDGLTVADLTIEVLATYASGATELVYGPAAGGFTALYSGGSAAPTTLPGTWIISRAGGWPANVTLSISVVDTDGLSDAERYSWRVISAVTAAASAPVVVTRETEYGSDVRTFLDLGNGPDLDPFMVLITDPRIVMAEAIARRLTMVQGALRYSANDGYDVSQLLNAALRDNDLVAAQMAIQQECLKDPRVQDAAVTVTLDRASGEMSVRVLGSGAAGPFSCVFSIASKSTGAALTALSFQ